MTRCTRSLASTASTPRTYAATVPAASSPRSEGRTARGSGSCFVTSGHCACSMRVSSAFVSTWSACSGMPERFNGSRSQIARRVCRDSCSTTRNHRVAGLAGSGRRHDSTEGRPHGCSDETASRREDMQRVSARRCQYLVCLEGGRMRRVSGFGGEQPVADARVGHEEVGGLRRDSAQLLAQLMDEGAEDMAVVDVLRSPDARED